MVRHVCVFVILLVAAARAAHGQVPAAVKVGAPVRFDITILTTVVVPGSDRRIDQLRVYHALPTPRSWATLPGFSVDTPVTFRPKSARLSRHEQTSADYLLWTLNSGFRPGKRLTFGTALTVISADRTFDPARAAVSWEGYDAPRDDPAAVLDPNHRPHPTLAEVAADLRKGRTPPEAVTAACEWVQKNIRYDASVPFDPTDMESLVKERRGHCGHMSRAVKDLTHSLGIPFRGVVGMNLMTPDGRSDELYAIRADYPNFHTWSEVWFPGVGWVEAEPSRGSKGFSIPAAYVQNNRWFQNYALWYREDGEHKLHEWTMSGGAYRSDWQLEHTISFIRAE
jgi:transglutaminase-like putative cysteine protease